MENLNFDGIPTEYLGGKPMEIGNSFDSIGSAKVDSLKDTVEEINEMIEETILSLLEKEQNLEKNKLIFLNSN
jgi:predicted transcriptional regulator